MKVVFVGPSLPDAKRFVSEEVSIRPPAIQGDLRLAVAAGARAIGLIDGAFESVAPVWHKEILYALSRGVTVFGAASIGALRAAECHTFGMIGVGEIFKAYASETLVDDADVALLHGPEELGYLPVTIPMINVVATVAWCVRQGILSDLEAQCLEENARSLFFKDRTWQNLAARFLKIGDARAGELVGILRDNFIDQKRADAIALIEALGRSGDYPRHRPSFVFNRTSLWRDERPD